MGSQRVGHTEWLSQTKEREWKILDWSKDMHILAVFLEQAVFHWVLRAILGDKAG